MHGLNGMGWGMGWWWVIGVIIILAIVWVVLKAMNNNTDSSNLSGNSALDILKERYAKGKISKNEFVEWRKNLV